MSPSSLLALCVLVSAFPLSSCTFTLTERNLLGASDGVVPPAPSDVTVEPLALPVEGATLRGWLLLAPGATRTIVYFYGNRGSVLSSAGYAAWLAASFSADVFAIDYRGHGFSDGEATFETMGADAIAVVDLARARFGSRPLYVMGYSLGTSLAVHAAAARPVSGLVLAAPPSSIEEVAEQMRARGPWYARLVRVEVEAKLAALPQPIDEIAKVDAPLLVVHGTADDVVPHWMGEKMLERAGTKPTAKSLCTAVGADHGSILTSAEARACLRDFFLAPGEGGAKAEVGR
jgi:uncharacterized protein